jgi:hypothetical protein
VAASLAPDLEKRLAHGRILARRPQQPVVQVRRRTETADAPGWPGARRENIAHM